MVSMEAIEAAVDQIAEGDDDINVNEELFDDDDDLDDLDFDDDEEEEEEPGI